MKKVRYATVGTSAITEKFNKAAALTGRYEYAAAYSRKAETGAAFAAKFGAKKVYTDLSALAADSDIDAVYIGSPNVCHYEQAKLLLSAKKHVLCEKPIFTSRKELDEMKSLADKNDVILLEAIKPRFYAPGRDALKSALKEIGEISAVRINFSQRSSRYDAFIAGEQVNIFDMSLHAGALNDIGVYCVYAAADLLGMPKNVAFAKANYAYNGADMSGTVVLDYGSFDCVITYSKSGDTALGSEFIGDAGTVRVRKISQYICSSLVTREGEKELVGDVDPVVTMAGEADRFAVFITDFCANADDYADFHILCRNVHTLMDEIRQKAGIIYVKNNAE